MVGVNEELVTDETAALLAEIAAGILTAATGFVAALSGPVAGLNQLGLLQPRPRRPLPRRLLAVIPPPSPTRHRGAEGHRAGAGGREPAPRRATARVTARLVTPVKLKGRLRVPANTTAILRLLRRCGL
jgi:hypothetical protein